MTMTAMRCPISATPRRTLTRTFCLKVSDNESVTSSALTSPLAEILMPLTSAANLNKHPSLAVAYTNKALEEMIKNAREMMEREQAALYKVKRLMVEFRGDDTWMPCGSLQTEHDSVLLGPQRLAALAQATSNAFGPNWESLSADLTMTDPESVVDMGILPEHDLAPGDMTENAAVHDAYEGIANVNEDADGRAESPERGAQSHTPEHQIEHDVIPSTETRLLVKEEGGAPMEVDHPEPQSAGPDATTATIDHAPGTEHNDATNITKAEENTEDVAEGLGADDDAQDTTAERPHRMTTRARAHASGADEATLPSPTQTSHPSPAPSVPSIHPFFMVPASALPSRDFNLPYDEAGDSRRLLSSYVQKQEEVCRGVARLLAGLQKALRLRRTVWQWCRAEGHVGEMSDGEDWYDREEWGLEEDLKKGEEAEEEEVVPGKKTRHRRAVA